LGGHSTVSIRPLSSGSGADHELRNDKNENDDDEDKDDVDDVDEDGYNKKKIIMDDDG
tara:strand:+ start:282 stop:455 length:174 start_codon:yes stop_codon:yes gene_type:complete